MRLIRLNVIATASRTPFGLFLVAWFLFSRAISSFSSLYPVLMLKGFGITVARSSMLMSIATGLSIPLYNVAGRLTTRFAPAAVLGLGIAVRFVALAGLGVLSLLHPVSPFLLVVLLFGAFQGIWPLLSVASNDLSPTLTTFGKGTAMGLFTVAAAIASAGGAIAGGAIATRFGYAGASLFAASITALSLVSILPLLHSSHATKGLQSPAL